MCVFAFVIAIATEEAAWRRMATRRVARTIRVTRCD
jgi:hypothetical protein